MNSIVVGLFITIMSLFVATSCNKALHKNNTTITAEESNHTHMKIEKCPVFVSNCEYPINCLVRSCKSAGFENVAFYIECLAEGIYVIHIGGLHGYASLHINYNESMCALDYYADDDTYDFADFMQTFIEEFESIERHEEWFEMLLNA